MSRRTLARCFKAIVLICALAAAEVQAQGAMVQGVVTNAHGQPLPGITVSLFHPAFGRSYPSYTDGWGRYAIYNVPPHPSPYFIEAYWGYGLVYRGQVLVRGPVQWHIRLQ